VPDRIFADARFAEIYDDLDGARDDLDHYERIIEELGAGRVLDIGCGTGVLACRLAARGLAVTGVDPAAASLAVAAARAGADRVSWVLGDASTLPVLPSPRADVATMTGNVAQVFLTDDEWSTVLAGARRALRPGGHLVFEARDPADRGWERWTREATFATIPSVAGPVEHWIELLRVALPLVSFRHTVRFERDGAILTSDSTLRFRDRAEFTECLEVAGFAVDEVRDAPDRPGREFVVIAHDTREPEVAPSPSSRRPSR
jgi:ubiquinone/menaquinone biosynthesis C-methylase UbiE